MARLSSLVDPWSQPPKARLRALLILAATPLFFVFDSQSLEARQPGPQASGEQEAAPTAKPQLAEPALFLDQTATMGLDFNHRTFATGEKYMPENMGAGVAVLDVDGDRRLDLFLVQGAPVALEASRKAKISEIAHRLYRQRQDGTFVDRTASAGFLAERPGRGVGMGVCFGDIDRDGDLDLYVTHYGPDALYRNRGDGTFEEVGAELGLDKKSWSTGCTFFDADGDGDLDLYVSSYVDFALDRHKYCGKARQQLRAYCHPDVYGAVADAFFRNEGGRFTDRSASAGIRPTPDGKGLGVASGDLDGDGDQDVLVANDSTMNYLYLGDGHGTFEESALFAGVGFNGAGAAEAGMGVVLSDLDGDLRPDLLLTHLDQETNTYFGYAGDGLFADRSDASGLGAPSLPWVGFGAVALDAELDGDLDIAVVNGHIIDNIALFDAARRHRQPAQFFENLGQRFRIRPEALDTGGDLIGRGLVAADLDRDGDEDLVLTQNGDRAKILRNTQTGGRSVTLTLDPVSSAPHGFGSFVIATLGDRRLLRLMPNAGSYLSQGPPEIVIGLGSNSHVEELEVHWSSGRVSQHGAVAAGSRQVLREPSADAPKPSPSQ